MFFFTEILLYPAFLELSLNIFKRIIVETDWMWGGGGMQKLNVL